MKNTPKSFYGKQKGEKIFYSAKPHRISLYFSIAKMTLAGIAIISLGLIIQNQIPSLPRQITFYLVLAGTLFALIGSINQLIIYNNSIAYVTNRRVIRFNAHTPFATSIRTLTWDQAVKAKTLPPNVVYKMLMVGDITIHSTSTVSAVDTKTTHNIVTNDDIELSNIYYYKDLGNYIEKIIYTFKNEPNKIKNIKPFVPKPKGKRY